MSESTVIAPKQLTPAQRDRLRVRAFKPIAIELGWLVYQWNRLHEALAELFTDIINLNVNKDLLKLGLRGGTDTRIPLAMWHAMPNDRPQRQMLRAALDAAYSATQTAKPREYHDIDWVLKQLEALAGRRNNALHAPLIFVNEGDAGTIQIMPNYFFGNPRATELKDKNLIEEFWWYKDHLARLAQFAELLHYAVAFSPDFPWPDRPQLPSRGLYRRRAPRRRKSKSK
jgi:hypothetical protein